MTARTIVATVHYAYDSEGNLVKKTVIADGTEQITYFEHHEDRTVVKFAVGEKTITAHAKNDTFGRKEFDELQLGAKSISRRFSYHEGEATTEHVAREMVKSAPTTQLVSKITFSDGRTLSYEYDEEERITKVTDSVDGVTEYTYDALGQLLTETVNGTVVNTMIYDNYGNIVSKNGVVYGYDTTWKDKLVSYGGQTISYDAQGNPTSYLGHTLLWEKGRQLKTFIRRVNNAVQGAVYYTYNANGIRTSKTINAIRHDFVLDGAKILKESWKNDSGVPQSLVPLYDNEDAVCGIVYNGTPYYFLKNLQGDIIAIADANGDTVARYTYDAWGVPTVTQDTTTVGIATINPYRYRGYYYDAEIGMYYLQSRYYDPIVGRFVTGDEATYLGVSGTTLGYDLYVYCENKLVNMKDATGNIAANVIGAIIGGIIGLVGGIFLGNWLANQLKITGAWERAIFIGAVSALVSAAAAAIGYFIGPYVAKAWNFLGARLTGLVKGSFKKIGKITAKKMSTKVNVSKHLWNKVLGKNVTTTNIKSLIYKTIRKGTWKYQSDGIIRIVLKQGKEFIVVTGNVVEGVFMLGDAWVWNGIGNLWGF